jgi:broad specificity phosphatase PhoE
MAVEIVYETHSLSIDNEACIATGWNEGALSEQGRRQARELGERRRNDELAAVYVSDLARALETVEIAFAGSALPIRRDARLRECDYGELNGAPVARIEQERAHRLDEPYPDGESYRDVVRRMDDLLDDIRREHDGERVLLVSHAAPKWALDHLLLGVPLERLVDAPFDWRKGWEYRA